MNDTANGRIELAPMLWSQLRDITDVKPVGDEDAECLAELRSVLEKHGRLDRFGVTLLHSHFAVNEDEVLLEYSDPKSRRLSTEVVPASATGTSVQTQFRFMNSGSKTLMWCTQQCHKDVQGNHYVGGHTRVGG